MKFFPFRLHSQAHYLISSKYLLTPEVNFFCFYVFVFVVVHHVVQKLASLPNILNIQNFQNMYLLSSVLSLYFLDIQNRHTHPEKVLKDYLFVWFGFLKA